MNFEIACSEVDFILENLTNEDKEKIPDNIKKFFKNNKSIFYEVNIDKSKKLKDQDLKDETKAFLKLIYFKCFANSVEKEKFLEKINTENDDTNIEEVSLENYKEIESESKLEMIEYKENIILKLLNKLKSFFFKK